MIFSMKDLSFRIIDVLKVDERNIKKQNAGRHFAALSFRKRSDARIEYGDKCLHMRDGSISFFPADRDYHRIAGIDKMTVIHFEVYNYDGKEIETYATENYQKAEYLFDRIYQTWNQLDPCRYYATAALINELLALIATEYLHKEEPEMEPITKAKRYIHDHYADPGLTIREVAASIGVSPEYLRRIFQRELGTPPKQYMQSLRIRKAAALLTSGYFSVKQTAQLCGFDDEKYFSIAFKTATGYSPSKYTYQFSEYKDTEPSSVF